MSYVNNHTTCIVFSGWLSSVFQIGKAAPPSPSKDKKKDMGSPLRNPGSPMRKNSQSDRRYLQIIHNTDTVTTQHLTNRWCCFHRSSVEKRSGPAGPAADVNGYQIRVWEIHETKTETQPWEDEDVCSLEEVSCYTENVFTPPLIIHLVD